MARPLSLSLVNAVFGLSLTFGVSACEPGPTVPPDAGDETPDESLDGTTLSGQGPGMAELTGVGADPEVVAAERLLAQGKTRDALETIDAAIVQRPEHARYHYVRGNILSHLERDDDARAAHLQAIDLDETDALPHAALGNLRGLQPGATPADKRAAIDHYQVALHLDPELATAHLSLGVVLLDLGRFEQAAEALENADRLAASVDTAYTLAQVYARLGDNTKAVAHVESALEFEPDASGADIRLLYARLLLKAGRDEDAAREFERTAKLVPRSPPLRLEVARGLLDLGRAEAAMVHLEWLLSVVPDEAPVLVNFGRALIEIGEPEKAILQLDAALERAPGSQAAAVYRIQALAAAGECRKAQKGISALSTQLHQRDGDPAPRAVVKARRLLEASGCK